MRSCAIKFEVKYNYYTMKMVLYLKQKKFKHIIEYLSFYNDLE